MPVTLLNPPAAETEPAEQRFVMGRVTWDAYLIPSRRWATGST
jgi:hypothetical protein